MSKHGIVLAIGIMVTLINTSDCDKRLNRKKRFIEMTDDVRGPYCQTKPGGPCCPGRDDQCTVPILDSICYCDMFCNITASDCCPDFQRICIGGNPEPITHGHTNPPPDKDFVCDTYACNSNEICRINNVGGAIRGQCMDDPGRHGIIVRFGCPFFLRAGQECYCNSRQCVNDARAVTTTSTTTTTTAPPPSGVPTFHPLCVDQDTRCALFKNRLCHATTQAYAIATCARTCNFCDQYIASLQLPTRPSTIQQTTSTTNTPTTVTTTTKPTTTSITTNPTTATSTTGPAKCNTCGDIDNYIPCFSRDVFSNQTSVCPAGHNFCMTDIYTDSAGNIDLYKRCVTEQTCNTKWTNDSAKFDYCRKYGVVANDNAYECHFCCTGDGCNTSIKPSDSTLVVPTSTTNTPTTVVLFRGK